jgi:hypothetical protein
MLGVPYPQLSGDYFDFLFLFSDMNRFSEIHSSFFGASYQPHERTYKAEQRVGSNYSKTLRLFLFMPGCQEQSQSHIWASLNNRPAD